MVAGGVGANRSLRERLIESRAAQGAQVFFPELQFCTDNGAMIALVGALRLAGGPRPRRLRVHVSGRAGNWRRWSGRIRCAPRLSARSTTLPVM